jgi:hypothetical protein
MYGSAQNNPSQNYVDAFPDANGYPIKATGALTVASTLYDPANPYANRDPRLSFWVGYNGASIGRSGYYTLATYEGGRDAFNLTAGTSRTGYYLRKLLRDRAINLTPGAGGTTTTRRCNILLGRPELYLTFAEAANEAWGPTEDPQGFGFTAADALERVVKKHYNYAAAAWTTFRPQHYLFAVIDDNADMFRDYVRNSRRLDLSFEGHYFYDLRRWIPDGSTATLNVDVYQAVRTIRNESGQFEYGDDRTVLEKRFFRSAYPPIPYAELYYKGSKIVQNKGWE